MKGKCFWLNIPSHNVIENKQKSARYTVVEILIKNFYVAAVVGIYSIGVHERLLF